VIPKALLTIAILGTAHPDVDLSLLGDDERSLEHALLRTIARLKLQARVGRVPNVDKSPLPEPCEADERSVCSLAAVQYLIQIIQENGSNREYKVEQLRSLFVQSWLDTLQTCRLRIAPEFLQVILSLVTRFQKQFGIVFTVMDEWSQQVAASYPARKMTLKYKLFPQMASTEHLNFLDGWWEKASLPLQHKLHRLLERGVVENDEAFLEALLDTAPRNTHYVLRGMLAQIPNSKFTHLMMDYARHLAHIEIIGGQHWFIVDRLENLDDPILERYGIIEKGNNTKTVVRRILSYVSPTFWCDHLGLSHDAFVAAIQHNKGFATTMWKALTSASLNYQQPQSADDIFDRAYRHLDRREKGMVAKLMSPKKLQSAAIKIMDYHSEALSRRHPAIPLLEGCDFEWTLELVTAFVGMMRQNIHAKIPEFRFQDVVARLMRTAAFHTPLAMRHNLMALFEDEDELSWAWSRLRKKAEEIFNFRQELLDVLEKDRVK
jgi:hypothetical protein